MRIKQLKRLDNFDLKITHSYYLTHKYLIAQIEESVNHYACGNVLDIGCGNKPYEGLFWKTNKVKSYIGCDITQSNLNKVDIICEANNIPLPNSSFETIFCTQVIEHVFDHTKLLKESYRLLKPGGILILSGPQYWPIHEAPFDFFRFTKFGFENLLKSTNFEVLEIKSNGGKYSVLGLAILHTLPTFLTSKKVFKWLINSIFIKLDSWFYDDSNTSNYLVIATKR